MNLPADPADDLIRRALRSIGDAAGPAPSFERLALPADEPSSPLDPRRRRSLVGALVAGVVAVAFVGGWQLLDVGDRQSTETSPSTSPRSEPTAPPDTSPSTPAPTAPPSDRATEPGWAQLPSPPLAPRAGSIAVWTGTKVIVVGGTGENLLCPPGADCATPADPDVFADGAAFDPRTNTWRPIADAPLPIANATATAVGGNVYVIEPCSTDRRYWLTCPKSCPAGACRDHVFLRYSVGDDIWEILPPSPGGVASLSAYRSGLLAAQETDENNDIGDYWFDPETGRWRKLPDDPLPASYDRQLVAQGPLLYLFAKPIAQSAEDAPAVRGARYDGRRNTWEELAPSPASGFDAWSVDHRVVINPHFSANSGGGVFEPSADKWSPLPDGPPDESWNGDMAGVVGRDSAEYGRSGDGWVLDVVAEQWLRMDRRDARPAVTNTAMTAVGRSLFAFGGERWDASGSEGELLDEAWIWGPPGVLDALDIRLELTSPTVPAGGTIQGDLVVENRSGNTVTDPFCWLGSGSWGLVPADEPDAELLWTVAVDCGADLEMADGFEHRRERAYRFPATMRTGQPLPAGEYLAAVEIEGRSERITAPVTVE